MMGIRTETQTCIAVATCNVIAVLCISRVYMISYKLFSSAIYDTVWIKIQRPFLGQKKAISQEMCCLLHLFMRELWGVQDGRHHKHQSQPSVFQLHAAFIDFSPSLLKCTINQYSNKSSFILEKCSFQLSGHEVLVWSMRPERQCSACDLLCMWPALHVTLGLIWPTTDCWHEYHRPQPLSSTGITVYSIQYMLDASITINNNISNAWQTNFCKLESQHWATLTLV